MRTEYVTTHDLNEGDTISHYGALLKLSNRKDWGRRADDSDAQGSCITFRVDLVGDDCGTIPRHWLTAENDRDRYTVQGNKLATWARVLAD